MKWNHVLARIVCPWPWWKNSPASRAICRVRRRTFARCYFMDRGGVMVLGVSPIVLRIARRLRHFGFRKKFEADLTPAFREVMPEQPWSEDAPTENGYYEVRMLASAWEIEPDSIIPSRIVFVEAGGRFDAGMFGGDSTEPLWEWRGPITVPEGA